MKKIVSTGMASVLRLEWVALFSNSRGSLPTRRHFTVLFVTALCFYLFIFNSTMGFWGIQGDSLCQIAYWKVLFREHLAGGISASQTKPGQVLLLGISHWASKYLGTWLLRFLLSICAALLASALSSISFFLGGGVPALFTFLYALNDSILFFKSADSSNFFLLCIYGGLVLYYWTLHKRWLGLVLLSLGVFFRVETVAVLGMVALVNLCEKKVGEFFKVVFVTFLTLSIWGLFIFKIQGSWDRLDSGNAAGYFSYAAAGTSGQLWGGIRYALGTTKWVLTHNYHIAFQCLLTCIGVYWLFKDKRRSYKGVPDFYFIIGLAPMLIVVANVLFKGGTIQDRYFASITAFGLSVGIPAVVNIIRSRGVSWHIQILYSVFALGLTCYTIMSIRKSVSDIETAQWDLQHAFSTEWGTFWKDRGKHWSTVSPGTDRSTLFRQFTIDGRAVLRENLFAKGSRLLSEDDILYILVLERPDHFAQIHTLQAFQVQSIEVRKEILNKTDYIYLSKSDEHGTYFFNYVVKDEWDRDPFRILMREMKNDVTGAHREIYGFNLTPIINDSSRLAIQVTPGTK